MAWVARIFPGALAASVSLRASPGDRACGLAGSCYELGFSFYTFLLPSALTVQQGYDALGSVIDEKKKKGTHLWAVGLEGVGMFLRWHVWSGFLWHLHGEDQRAGKVSRPAGCGSLGTVRLWRRPHCSRSGCRCRLCTPHSGRLSRPGVGCTGWDAGVSVRLRV